MFCVTVLLQIKSVIEKQASFLNAAVNSAAVFKLVVRTKDAALPYSLIFTRISKTGSFESDHFLYLVFYLQIQNIGH